MVAILILPLLAIAGLQWLLYDLMFSIPALLFGILVFAYCLGPACLSSDIDDYLDARRMGDEDEAMHYAASLTERAASTSPDQQTSDVTRAILYVANERIFSVIFWFVILGPIGAVLYRLVTFLGKIEDIDANTRAVTDFVQGLLSWAPARMLALGYALTGHFDGAVHAFSNRPKEPDISLSNYDVLVITGMGALRDHEATDEVSAILAARNLIMRAIMVWIAVLAVMTLGGWLG
jgi:membrane protein required for beta-lactamase induction